MLQKNKANPQESKWIKKKRKKLFLVTFHQTKKSDTLGVKSSFKNQELFFSSFFYRFVQKMELCGSNRKANSLIFNSYTRQTMVEGKKS